MSDLKIYNNGENKVLMSAGDRIIRQPYEFGNSLLFHPMYKMSITPNVPFDIANHSILLIVDTSSSLTFYDEFLLSKITFDDNSIIEYNMRERGSADGVALRTTFKNHLGVVNDTDNDSSFRTIKNKPILFLIEFQSDKSSYLKTNRAPGLAVERTKSPFSTSFVQGQSSIVKSIELNISANYSIGSKINQLSIFDRNLSLSEIIFKYNNGLYSGYQTTDGCVYNFMFDKASSVNCEDGAGGVSLSPGVLNTVFSNKSISWDSLPAGSLEDQLAYANANLFVPFIQ